MASHCSPHLNYIIYSNWQISQQIESQVFSFLIISAFFFISGQCGWLFNFFVWSVSVTIILFLVCWPQLLLCLVSVCDYFTFFGLLRPQLLFCLVCNCECFKSCFCLVFANDYLCVVHTCDSFCLVTVCACFNLLFV